MLPKQTNRIERNGNKFTADYLGIDHLDFGCRIAPQRLLKVTGAQQRCQAEHKDQRNHERIFGCCRSIVVIPNRLKKLV